MRNIVRCKTTLFLFFLLFLTAGCEQKKLDPPAKAVVKPRIVSLAPSLTEMIFAIGAGDQLVGRTSACDWPAAATRIPVIGAFGRPSLELLLSIHPDLVVDVDLADEGIGKKIVAMGLQRASFTIKSPDDIPVVLGELGKLTGHTREADSLARSISNGLAAFKKKAGQRQNKTKVYLEIWDDPLWTGGKSGYTSSLIAYAGGENIGDVVNKDYFEILQEWVIKRNPDVIACMYMAREASAAGKVIKRPGWSSITAVKNNRIYDRFDNNLFLRPGPRVLEGIAQLHKVFYPDEQPLP